MEQHSASDGACEGSGIERIQLGDIEVAFRRTGQGEPAVFIHGLTEDHNSWNPVIERLEPGICAYTPDLRGMGGTSAGKCEGTASQLAGDLLAFLEKVTGPAVCVGF